MLKWLVVLYGIVFVICITGGGGYLFAAAVIMTIFEPQIFFAFRETIKKENARLIVLVSTLYCLVLWLTVIFMSPLGANGFILPLIAVAIAIVIRYWIVSLICKMGSLGSE